MTVTSFASPPNDTAICSLDDVKAYLRMPLTDTSYDAELTNLTFVATDMIERYCNLPIVPKAMPIERHDGWVGDTIELKYAPVVSVTYVHEFFAGFLNILSESTPANPIDGYQLEYQTGRLVRVFTNGFPRQWYPGSRNIEISYSVGLSPIPPTLWQAARELVGHIFSQQEQINPSNVPKFSGGVGSSDEVETSPEMWQGIPYRIEAKLKTFRHRSIA